MTFSELTSEEIDQVAGGKEVDWAVIIARAPNPLNPGNEGGDA